MVIPLLIGLGIAAAVGAVVYKEVIRPKLDELEELKKIAPPVPVIRKLIPIRKPPEEIVMPPPPPVPIEEVVRIGPPRLVELEEEERLMLVQKIEPYLHDLLVQETFYESPKWHNVIIEHDASLKPEYFASLGIQMIGISKRMPVTYAIATKKQILHLAQNPRINKISSNYGMTHQTV